MSQLRLIRQKTQVYGLICFIVTSVLFFGYLLLYNISCQQIKHGSRDQEDKFSWDEDRKIFLLNEKPVIWSYWSSGVSGLPEVNRLCLESIQCHNPNYVVKVVSKDSIGKFISNIHPSFEYLTPNDQSNYFRCLILEYGGIYVDLDTVGFASLDSKFDLLKQYDAAFVSWPPENSTSMTSIIGPIRGKTAFQRFWRKTAEKVLDEKLPTLLKRAEAFERDNKPIPYPFWQTELGRRGFYAALNNFKDPNFKIITEDGTKYYSQMFKWSQRWHVERKLPEKGFNFTEAEFFFFHQSFEKVQSVWEQGIGAVLSISLQKCKEGKSVMDPKNRRMYWLKQI